MKKQQYGNGRHKSSTCVSKVSRTKVVIGNDERYGSDGVGMVRIRIG